MMAARARSAAVAAARASRLGSMGPGCTTACARCLPQRSPFLAAKAGVRIRFLGCARPLSTLLPASMPPRYDYEEERKKPKVSIPERYNFARDVFDKHVEARPDHLCLLEVSRGGSVTRHSYADVARASKRVANALVGLGVMPGDVVKVALPRVPEWHLLNLALLRIGAVITPGTLMLQPKDLKERVLAAKVTCVIATAGLLEKLDEALEELTDGADVTRVLVPDAEEAKTVPAGKTWHCLDDLTKSAPDEHTCVDTESSDRAMLFFTSGTTGAAKMAVHNHVSYAVQHSVSTARWLDLGAEDLHWNYSDGGWAKAAWSSFYAPLGVGCSLFVHDAKSFDPKETLEMLQAHPISTFCGAPTVYRIIVRSLGDLESPGEGKPLFPALRHCVSAGEPLNPEVIDVWKEASGIIIRDGYGQTETCCLVGSYRSFEARYGSMGKPSPGYTIKVVDAEGNECPVDTEGDIGVATEPERPVGLFGGYLQDEERTKSCYRGHWYLTGDRATRDADGYLWFVGRSDDVINTAGYRVGPFEVESALIEHEAVLESAAVASPDPARGEVVKAFIVLSSGYEPSDELRVRIQEHVKTTTAPYKYPRKIEFVESLPKTVSGKIRRVELRQREFQK